MICLIEIELAPVDPRVLPRHVVDVRPSEERLHYSVTDRAPNYRQRPEQAANGDPEYPPEDLVLPWSIHPKRDLLC